MQTQGSRQELYERFIGFVVADQQRERSTLQRRMFSVFVWCFLVPASISLTALLMAKLGFLPRSLRYRIDWLILLFPMIYSLYILSSEVLVNVPRTSTSEQD